MNNSINLMIDLDTLSHNVYNGVVIDVAAYVFDTSKMLSDSPYSSFDVKKVKKFKLSLKEQKESGREIDKSVSEYWQSLGENTINRIKSKPDDLTVKQFVNQFRIFLGTEPGIQNYFVVDKSYHYNFLDGLFRNAGENIQDTINRKWVIDTRSFLFGKLGARDSYDFCPVEDEVFWNKIYDKNNSSFDVISNILKIQKVLRLENDLENVNR